MLGDYRASGVFGERDLAVLGWAESVARNTARRDRAGFEACQRFFGDAEIVELTVIAAQRTMVNLIQEALWTDLEDDSVPKNTRAVVDGQVLRDYLPVLEEQLARDQERT